MLAPPMRLLTGGGSPQSEGVAKKNPLMQSEGTEEAGGTKRSGSLKVYNRVGREGVL